MVVEFFMFDYFLLTAMLSIVLYTVARVSGPICYRWVS